MGYAAAVALAKELSDWCTGPDEACEILRADRESDGGVKRDRCPICNARKKGPDGVIAHMKAKHTKADQAASIAAFQAMYGPKRKKPSLM